jgi:VanZ family protein
MLKLRFPWVWWSLGWVLVAGVVFGSLLPGRMMVNLAPSDKLLHAGSYFILMLWFAGLYPRERYALIAFLLLALGLALDLAQGFSSSRVFDMRDVAANAGGIIIGLLLARLVIGGWCQRVEQLFLSR